MHKSLFIVIAFLSFSLDAMLKNLSSNFVIEKNEASRVISLQETRTVLFQSRPRTLLPFLWERIEEQEDPTFTLTYYVNGGATRKTTLLSYKEPYWQCEHSDFLETTRAPICEDCKRVGEFLQPHLYQELPWYKKAVTSLFYWTKILLE